jgi:hypothetical protein
MSCDPCDFCSIVTLRPEAQYFYFSKLALDHSRRIDFEHFLALSGLTVGYY